LNTVTKTLGTTHSSANKYFIRRAFITNSSSTSFIFYGFETELSYKAGEKLGEIAHKSYPAIAVHPMWDSERTIIYHQDSYLSLWEGGVMPLPMSKLRELMGYTREQELGMAKQLRRFCDANDIPHYVCPEWSIAINVER